MKAMCTRLLLAVVLPLTAADAQAAVSARIEGSAGLAGIARAGRWMPVDVRLVATDADIDGELVATWGNASVHRAVSAAAPSVTTIELHLRTSDPRDRVHLELRSGDLTLATADFPVRLASSTDTITVCIEGIRDADRAADNCTARISPGALPRSARGLEAADAVVWHGAESELSAPQRQALQTWQAYRQLLDSDTGWAPRLTPLAQEPAVSQRTRTQAAAAGAAYVGLLVVAASWGVTRRRLSTARRYLVVTGVVAAATAGAVFAGQSSVAGPVHVRHATMLQQLDNGWSVVSTRGTVTFPAFAAYRLSADLDDGSVRLEDYPRHVYWSDEAGRPVVAGTFRLGSSIPLELEGYLHFAPLTLDRQGQQVRVTNTSEATMRGCGVLHDFAETERFELAPGASAAAPVTRTGPAIVSCTFTGLPIGFRESKFGVEVTGEVLLNAFLPGEPSRDGADRR